MTMKHLFSELDVAGVRLANRIVLPPMATEQADAEGHPSPTTADYYGSLAATGVALVVVEHSYVAPEGGAPPRRCPVRCPDKPCRVEPAGGDARKMSRPKRHREPGFASGPGGNVEQRYRRNHSRFWGSGCARPGGRLRFSRGPLRTRLPAGAVSQSSDQPPYRRIRRDTGRAETPAARDCRRSRGGCPWGPAAHGQAWRRRQPTPPSTLRRGPHHDGRCRSRTRT